VEIKKDQKEKEKQKIFRGSPVKYCLECGKKKWSCRCYKVTGIEELKNAKRRMLSESKSKF
jgi:DTW domain-containing protein YfiP